jgi:hypothetical protein
MVKARLADIGAAVAIGVSLSGIVHLLADIAATASGTAAAIYYIIQIRAKHKADK